MSFVRFSYSPLPLKLFCVVRHTYFWTALDRIFLQTSDCTNFCDKFRLFLFTKYLYHIQFTFHVSYMQNKLAKPQLDKYRFRNDFFFFSNIGRNYVSTIEQLRRNIQISTFTNIGIYFPFQDLAFFYKKSSNHICWLWEF